MSVTETFEHLMFPEQYKCWLMHSPSVFYTLLYYVNDRKKKVFLVQTKYKSSPLIIADPRPWTGPIL